MQLFEEKIKLMTGKEIVMAMVEGLQNNCVVVDMDTFGQTRDGVCFGCAATNTVCHITGIKPEYLKDGDDFISHAEAFKVGDDRILKMFEYAIDSLRKGHINDYVFDRGYNSYAKEIGIALLPEPAKYLPYLSTDDYLENLQAYIDYANTLTDEV